MLGGLALSLVATRLEAAEARYRLSIAPTSYADALIDLGVQANVSIIGTSSCGPGGRTALVGILTLDEALDRLLAGAPCAYRILDPRTVRIAAAPRPAAQPATRAVEPPRPPTLVPELLVTATKRPASINRVAASITVVPHDQMELTGSQDVMQAAGQIAGVLTTNLGPGRDKLILRGLSDGAFTGRARSTVGSYLDEAPVNYNAPDPDLPLVDAERIEVVRGPQGALYGSGSLSGVYRIVTRKPDISRSAFGAAVLGAETTGGSPSHEVEGYWNLPIVKDYAAVRLVAYHDVEGGYIDNAALRLSNVDRTTRDGGRISLRLQPSDAWQVDLSIVGQRLRSNDTQYATSMAASPTARTNRVREGHKNDFGEASATVRGELGWATLRSTLAYVDHAFSSQYDASNPDLLSNFHAEPTALGVYFERTRIHMLVEDTVLHSAGPGPLSWLAGLYGVATVEKSPTELDIQDHRGRLGPVYAESRRDRVREAAFYGEADYDFGNGWTAALGGRLFTGDVQTTADVAAVAPGVPRAFDGHISYRGFSPKLSIQYEIGPDALVYALFSEGYRAGGFNSGGILAPIRPTRTSFKPDRLRNYELGLKTRLLDRRLNLRAAVFYDRWSDIQTDQYRPSGLPYTANVGDADVWGLETEASYDFDFGLSVKTGWLFASSRITRANPDFAPKVVHRLPNVPDVSGGVLAVYQRSLSPTLTLRLIGETSYVGGSPLSFDASYLSRIDGYTANKLSAEIAGRAWTATLFVTNPTNDTANTFAYGNPFTFGNVRQSTPQRPRTIGLRLTFDE